MGTQESIRTLEEEINRNLTQENDINRMVKGDLGVQNYLNSLSENFNYDFFDSSLKEAQESWQEFKEKHFGHEEKVVTTEVEGVVQKGVKKYFTKLFGGKEEEVVPASKGLIYEDFEKLSEVYEEFEEISQIPTKLKTVFEQSQENIDSLNKTYIQAKVQAKQLLQEETTLEGFLESIDRELQNDELEVVEYQTLSENRQKVSEKLEGIKEYFDVVGFQLEEVKQYVDYFKEDHATFRKEIRSMESDLAKTRIRMDTTKILMMQAKGREKFKDFAEGLPNIYNAMESTFGNAKNILERSHELYLENRERIKNPLIKKEDISKIGGIRKNLYRQSDEEQGNRRERIMNILYNKE